MPLTTTLHFERHLFDAATIADAMREAADLVAELEGRGSGLITEIRVNELSGRGSAVVMFRQESDDEIDEAEALGISGQRSARTTDISSTDT